MDALWSAPLQTVRPELFGRPEALEATGVRTGFAGLPEDEDDGNRRTDYEVNTTRKSAPKPSPLRPRTSSEAGGQLQAVRPDLFGGPEALEATGVRTGFAGLPEDQDDGNRRADYEVATSAGIGTETFAFAAADLARHGALRAEDLPTAPRRAVDEQSDSTTWIDYRGPSGTVRRVSALDVLDGRVAPGTFRDKRVVVGVTAPVTSDVHDTPFDRMRGPEVQANALDTILRGAPMRDVPRWWTSWQLCCSPPCPRPRR